MTFEQWKELCERVHAMADRVYQMRSARGWAMAATVGIPRNGCCIHNASIDTACTEWSAAGPHVYKTARRALRLIEDYSASRLAERITARAWAQVA